MTGWNATMRTRDGEPLEPSDKFKGTHSNKSEQPSVASSVNAYELEEELTETRPTGETFRCPECNRLFEDRNGEADCARAHARERADKLQRWADDGHDVLKEVCC